MARRVQLLAYRNSHNGGHTVLRNAHSLRVTIAKRGLGAPSTVIRDPCVVARDLAGANPFPIWYAAVVFDVGDPFILGWFRRIRTIADLAITTVKVVIAGTVLLTVRDFEHPPPAIAHVHRHGVAACMPIVNRFRNCFTLENQ